ncbi:MAG: hypothetical protein Q8O56_12890 [Solirubrobacteraceae bacterium]|nr:hypothetical protein [Solirubrobacteraceae bacterium]
MPYALLPDELYDDPRIVRAGLAALGLYAACFSYSARHMTDGEIPGAVGRRWLDDDDSPLRALVEAGLVELEGEEWVVPEFLAHNPTREKREAEARRKAENVARWRQRQQASPSAGEVPF